MPQNLDVRLLFKRLGLKPPRFTVTNDMPFIEPRLDDHEVYDSGPPPERRECTCCSCYFNIGPPGCDGTNCHDCGGRC